MNPTARLLLATIAAALALPAAAAIKPTAERECRLETNAKGARVAMCAPVEKKDDKSAARIAKPAKAGSIDCKTATKPTDKLACLAAQLGEAEEAEPAPGNDIG